MTDKLRQTIKREVGKLTKENQDVINAFGWENIIEEISKKYLFNEGEINILQAETLIVLVGLEDPDFYVNNIENDIGISKDEANKITDEIFEKIFIPINNLLIENIKKSGVVGNSNMEQNLNFIVSGGDYSTFLTPISDKNKNVEKEKIPTSPMITPSLADIKANTQNTKITDINGVIKLPPKDSTVK